MSTITEVPQPSWIDQTFRVAENAEVEVDQHPNGDLEISIHIPECPTSRITVIWPAKLAAIVNAKARELIAVAPAIALAIIVG